MFWTVVESVFQCVDFGSEELSSTIFSETVVVAKSKQGDSLYDLMHCYQARMAMQLTWSRNRNSTKTEVNLYMICNLTI